MTLLRRLLEADPGAPRLTIHDEARGFRLDFSAATLQNWAAKVANLLIDELAAEPGTGLARIDLPVCWQTAAVALGCLSAGVDWELAAPGPDGEPDPRSAEADMVFCTPERLPRHEEAGDLLAVNPHPYGRGVAEEGGELPDLVIDFGPAVRVHGDVFPGRVPALPELIDPGGIPPGARCLGTGWRDTAGLVDTVLRPLAAGGSAVVVAGLVDAERLAGIARTERVTLRL